MKYIIGILVFALALGACSTTPKFEVKGTVKGGKGETVVFERAGLDGIAFVDSVKLGSSETFSFKSAETEYPEFYRLRLGQQIINLALDSTETIVVTADKETFESSYQVSGSAVCEQMRQLNQVSTKVKSDILSLNGKLTANEINREVFALEMKVATDTYKQVATPIILSDPSSPVAYFALFQRVFGYLIYDLNQREDLKIFGAVATSYAHHYPNGARTLNLSGMTLQAMKALRQDERPAPEYDLSKATELNHIEIDLFDQKGRKQKMSTVIKGKPSILSFTVYKEKFSPGLNMVLGEAHEKYKAKGLTIYQVSFDTDEHFFKISASNLPWTSVWDTSGPYSELIKLYNIDQLPILYLLNNKGEIVKRITELNKLDAEIAKII